IIREAKEEARQILKDANKLVENTIAEIKSVQADKEKTKEIRRHLHTETAKHAEKKIVGKPEQNVQGVDESIVEGDWVKIVGTHTEAQVIEVSKGNNLILALGELRTVVKKNKVVKLRGKEKAKVVKKHKSIATESAADFRPEL